MNKTRIYAWAAGLATAVLALGYQFLVGSVIPDGEALRRIEALKSSSLYFGSAMATSSATILALMLTLLGLTRSSDNDFDASTYGTVQKIARNSTMALCGAIALLLILSIPVGEFKEIPAQFYPVAYGVLSFMNAAISGLLIATVLQLFFAITYVIRTIRPRTEEEKKEA